MKEKEEYTKKFFGNCYNHKNDEYIYKDPNGNLVKPGYVTQHFKKWVIEKNPHLKTIRFHDLRHSCAPLLRSEGVPLEDIQKWLGHSQITNTEKLYAHFEYKTHLKSAEKISNAFHIEEK
jgi:integrase